MKSVVIFFFFSFLVANTEGQSLLYPSMSSFMSTVYEIDSASFRLSIDNGDSFGEWQVWPIKFDLIAIENIDSSIVVANTMKREAVRYKYYRIKEYDNSRMNIYYGILYKCWTATNVPLNAEFLHYAGSQYQIIIETYTPPSIFTIKYFVHFGRYYKDKWIYSMVNKYFD